MSEDFPDVVRDAVLRDPGFVSAEFRRGRGADDMPWTLVTVRPVALRDQIQLQFSYFDGRQDFSKNYPLTGAGLPLDDLMARPFGSIVVRTTSDEIRVQFSRKRRPIVHRETRPAGDQIAVSLAHDRPKGHLLPDDEPVPFLQAIGVQTGDGRVRAEQRRKFRQINEFVRVLAEAAPVDQLAEPLRVVDLGCGSAALTFATYYYLSQVAGLETEMTGVDAKASLLERHTAIVRTLGWDNLRFEAGQIIDYAPAHAPDIVLALHACDTATDEALSQAVAWESALILCAPCCHHHLQAQLAAAGGPPELEPILRHGILRERFGDVATDALRAQILRLMGYRTDVIEFVTTAHTPKNLLIRAERTGAPPTPELISEYEALKAAWGVTPYLESLLGERLAPLLVS